MERRAWTGEEVALLTQQAASSSLMEIAAQLDRPLKMVRWKAHRLGLPVIDGRSRSTGAPRSAWTEERLDYVREHIKTETAARVAEALGVTEKNLRSALNYYGISGRGRTGPQDEQTKQKKRDSAASRLEARYPSAGPWTCLQCSDSKPLEEFAQGASTTHVCFRCERSNRLTRTYGMSLDEYERKLEEQHGLCALCDRPESRETERGRLFPLAVDHDHTHCSGKTGCPVCVRDLLCWECNNMLGKIEKVPGLEYRVVAYLEKHRR